MMKLHSVVAQIVIISTNELFEGHKNMYLVSIRNHPPLPENFNLFTSHNAKNMDVRRPHYFRRTCPFIGFGGSFDTGSIQPSNVKYTINGL